MSPLNIGPIIGPRMAPVGMRPPLPRFGGRFPPPGIPPRMPLPLGPMFGPIRQRMPPLRPGGPPPLFGPRGRGLPPLMPPMMGPRGMGPRGLLMRPGPLARPGPGPRGLLPPQGLPHMRPRFPPVGGNSKVKAMNAAKKVSKLEELELKKPWMTDEIRCEIQKKNKLYAKAKKNKDAKEWEEFKDLRNKVTRMIRDAKNDYLAKHPDQADVYPSNEEPYDQRSEYSASSEDEDAHYCEVCDRDFRSSDDLARHKLEHQTCGIEDCTFSAHPKLVERHIAMQHSSGLYQRMRNLSTPEDIQKWITERKKKYPTKANIELRKAEKAEKAQRGELIERQYSSVNRRKMNQAGRRERKRKLSRQSITEAKLKAAKNSLEAESVKKVDVNVDGLKEEKISDENERNVNNRGIVSLVANYESDSNEDDCPEEVPIKRQKLDATPTVTAARDASSTSSNANIEVRIAKEPEKSFDTNENIRNKVNAKVDSNKSSLSDYRNSRNQRSKQLQLLDRLLSRSIQHERNLICQCVKYIIDNNFFE